MKIFRQTIIWTTLLFIGLTALTMTNKAAVDGINAFGFPLTFYSYVGGECVNCNNFFNAAFLVVDIATTAIIVSISIWGKNKLIAKK